MAPLKRFFKILYAILREIGDESAYARHLAAHNTAASGPEWRRFSEHRLQQKYHRPRCC